MSNADTLENPYQSSAGIPAELSRQPRCRWLRLLGCSVLGTAYSILCLADSVSGFLSEVAGDAALMFELPFLVLFAVGRFLCGLGYEMSYAFACVGTVMMVTGGLYWVLGILLNAAQIGGERIPRELEDDILH